MGSAGHSCGLRAVAVLDSVTDLTVEDRHKVAVTASHGGLASGRHALAHGVAAVVFNDAGHGLNDAGTRSLGELDAAGVPAVAVAHMSARIGDGRDTLASGLVSRSNAAARALGVRQGDSCAAAVEALRRSTAQVLAPDTVGFGAARYQVGQHPVIVLDSASRIGSEATGRVVVTGSHGGLPGNRTVRAIKYPVRFAAFNDAGVGKDRAGIARVAVLQSQGVAAVTVLCDSAEIGDGRSTLRCGIVSHANNLAAQIGARPGMPLLDVIGGLPG